jgi:hypothetical protein
LLLTVCSYPIADLKSKTVFTEKLYLLAGRQVKCTELNGKCKKYFTAEKMHLQHAQTPHCV